MGISDRFLEEHAKAMNGETFIIPSYLAVGSADVDSISNAATTLSDEIGTRVAMTGSRTDNTLKISAIRSGTAVIDTVNGDDITQSGAHGTLAGSDLLVSAIHNGVTQTTNFDLETEYTLGWDRR